MTAVYAIVLVLAILGLLAWVAATAVADTVDGWSHVDPNDRYGARGRSMVAGAMGFGLGGMSATFAGWAPLLAALGAVAGAGAMALVAARYGPSARTEGHDANVDGLD